MFLEIGYKSFRINAYKMFLKRVCVMWEFFKFKREREIFQILKKFFKCIK